MKNITAAYMKTPGGVCSAFAAQEHFFCPLNGGLDVKRRLSAGQPISAVDAQ